MARHAETTQKTG